MWIRPILSVDGHLDCFHFLAIKNNAAMNIQVQVWRGHVFNSIEYLPSSGMLSHDSLFHESLYPAFECTHEVSLIFHYILRNSSQLSFPSKYMALFTGLNL